jgi:CRP-like cAMP-binding protein
MVWHIFHRFGPVARVTDRLALCRSLLKVTELVPPAVREWVKCNSVLSRLVATGRRGAGGCNLLTVKARVARALLELAEFVGKPSGSQCFVLDEKIGHADLAAMAGVARENVSRVLSEWRRRNLVVTGVSPRFRLNDIAALKREIDADA